MKREQERGQIEVWEFDRVPPYRVLRHPVRAYAWMTFFFLKKKGKKKIKRKEEKLEKIIPRKCRICVNFFYDVML